MQLSPLDPPLGAAYNVTTSAPAPAEAVVPPVSIEVLLAKAKTLRRHVVTMVANAGSGHPGGSLSAVEVVAALYFGGILRYRPEDPEWADRDRFILSKGPGVPGRYAALAEA